MPGKSIENRVILQIDPVGPHGRWVPYSSTEQAKGRFFSTRGNTPQGVSVKKYKMYYNRADSRILKAKGKREQFAAREYGRTRDFMIDLLIADGKLPADFVDDDV
ncbi:hypothetical protein N431DRAFT_342833 [Stipitochalara longipes BDJ]|nr:hypothetical protein N431DRAFT_342833 [Stipitochalara longipes BDJ]